MKLVNCGSTPISRETDETVLKNMVGLGEIETDKKPFPIDVDWTG